MAVTENQLIAAQGAGGLQKGLVVASMTLYQGTLAFSVAASGYITDAIAAGANHFMGIVKEKVDNSGGSSGDKAVELYTKGRFRMFGSSFTQALVGDKIYAIDNFTVDATSASQTLVGRCVEFISDTEIVVDIEVGVQA